MAEAQSGEMKEMKSFIYNGNDVKVSENYYEKLVKGLSATEIERQANRIVEEVDNFLRASRTIIKRLENLSRTVASEDSNLSKQIGIYQEAYIRIQGSIESNFSELAGTMRSYVRSTLHNEEDTQKEVTTLGNSLNDLISEVNNINFN